MNTNKRSVLERSSQQAPGTGYFEHDNRLAPDYDDYNDDYTNEYPSRGAPNPGPMSANTRPPKYATPYKFDHRFNSPLSQSGSDSYRNGAGAGNGNTPYPAIKMNFGANSANQMVNGIQNVAQAFMNTMVSKVAPIIQSQMNQTVGYGANSATMSANFMGSSHNHTNNNNGNNGGQMSLNSNSNNNGGGSNMEMNANSGLGNAK